MDRDMPQEVWRKALLSLSDIRRKLLETEEVEAHLLTEKVRLFLEDEHPFMAAIVLRQILRDHKLPADVEPELTAIADLLARFEAVSRKNPNLEQNTSIAKSAGNPDSLESRFDGGRLEKD